MSSNFNIRELKVEFLLQKKLQISPKTVWKNSATKHEIMPCYLHCFVFLTSSRVFSIMTYLPCGFAFSSEAMDFLNFFTATTRTRSAAFIVVIFALFKVELGCRILRLAKMSQKALTHSGHLIVECVRCFSQLHAITDRISRCDKVQALTRLSVLVLRHLDARRREMPTLTS